METVGNRIRRRRKERLLNQWQLAKLVGISQSTLSELEPGESKMPSADVLQGLAKHLGVTQAWIITGKDGELEMLTQEEEDLIRAARGLSAEQRRAIYNIMTTMKKEE